MSCEQSRSAPRQGHFQERNRSPFLGARRGRNSFLRAGSCGAVVACILNGLTERNVRVRTPGGSLNVARPEEGEGTLTGPVVRVAGGSFYYRK